MNKENKLVVFLDSVNRTILAELVKSNPSELVVINPAIISIMPKPNGQMSAQLIPVFFREILNDKNHKCVFTYSLSSIALTNITSLDKQFETQYFNLFKDIETAQAESAPKLDLFEEKK